MLFRRPLNFLTWIHILCAYMYVFLRRCAQTGADFKISPHVVCFLQVFIYSIYLFAWVWKLMFHNNTQMDAEDAVYWLWFYPPITWVTTIKLGSSLLVASTFTYWTIHSSLPQMCFYAKWKTVTKFLKYIILFLCSWLIKVFPACHHQTFPSIKAFYPPLVTCFLPFSLLWSHLYFSI